ncbi:CHAT domain-containing protein [Fulvivirgaceae bacterium BMA12]|uniref:CHAT domain-containing protein n=1 Tax=Agaribacillus aureus TaxID=3051825 RepID=A0ABT8LAI8_9BACT|nr:CHAT domain-containing protein [Fulvivirgaceae bacterium BMA12]
MIERMIIVLWLFYPTLSQSALSQDTGATSANEYVRTAEMLITSNIDSAIFYYKKAAVIFKNNGDWGDYIRCRNEIGYNYYILSEYSMAKECIQTTLNIGLKYLGDTLPEIAFSYKNMGVIYGGKGDYKNEIINYNKALEILLNHGGSPEDIANIYNDIGFHYGNVGEYDKELSYYNKALDIFITIYGEDSDKFTEIYNNIGYCYGNKGNNRKELEYYQKVLALELKATDQNIDALARARNNIGYCYYFEGDYDKALLFYNKALNSWQEIFLEENLNISHSYNNIGSCYLHLKDFQKALNFFEKSLKIKVKLSKNEENVWAANVYSNISRSYLGLGDSKNGLENIVKALKIQKRFKKHIDAARSYGIMADFYVKEEPKKALFFYKKAKTSFINIFGNKHPYIGESCLNLGKYYLKQKKWNLAIRQFQNALTALVADFDDSNITTNPLLHNISSEITLLEVLRLKAETLETLYTNQPNTDEYLISAFNTYQLATKLIDTLRYDYTERSAQNLTENSMPVYEGAIRTAYELFKKNQGMEYVQLAFKIVQKSKAFLLVQALNDAEAKYFTGIPDSLIEKERILKINLANYQKQLNLARNKKDSSKIKGFQNILFEFSEEHKELIQKLELNYPNYYQLKHERYVSTINNIRRSLLDENSVLLEYFVGESSIYIFSLTNQEFHVYSIKKPFDFDNLVRNFRKSVGDYRFITDSISYANRLYINSAHRLYQLLLSKPLNEISIPPEKITIAPSGTLGYVNFDVLLTKPPMSTNEFNFKNLDYLIKDYQLSYIYSTATLINRRTTSGKRLTKLKFGGYASEYDSSYPINGDSMHHDLTAQLVRSGNLPLLGALKEVKKISQMTGGEAWVGKLSTERNFKKNADRYGILHLSMHALLNDTNPLFSQLLFTQSNDSIEDNLLNVMEIYNMRFNADLVVLSACNSGYGKIKRGEGIMSLARAFAYAGCPSIVMSLWQVPDDETFTLMVEFYTNILKGKSKDHALRSAKLHYLAQTENPSKAHPFFWAAFVPLGDMTDVQIDRPFSKLYILISGTFMFIVFLVLYFLFFRRRSKRKISVPTNEA